MQVEFEFYTTVRDAVGERSVARDLPAGATVTDGLLAVAADHPGLESLVVGDDGTLRPHVNVLVDGTNVRRLSGGETELTDGTTVAVQPGVSGG